MATVGEVPENRLGPQVGTIDQTLKNGPEKQSVFDADETHRRLQEVETLSLHGVTWRQRLTTVTQDDAWEGLRQRR